MHSDPPKIKPLGESAVVVEFGSEISEEINAKAIALADYLDRDPFPGFIEAVPAYASTTVFFDIATVARSIAFGENISSFVEGVLNDSVTAMSVATLHALITLLPPLRIPVGRHWSSLFVPEFLRSPSRDRSRRRLTLPQDPTIPRYQTLPCRRGLCA